ncbi:FAD-dependent thymidylate synthase [Deinococcus pimensis]|uniref:FAD-dependent thymidylate synthase n=1 Tax=Deinococcus pimensis TaxID=309888 RepID=UPI0004B303B0|nr:FAD-dependent thymidylate synthase [Deinococcus pimensis]
MTAMTAEKILYPLADGVGSVALVQHVGDDKSVVNAARVSFGGDNSLPLDARDEKLIRYLLREKHGSPFEHNLITYKIVCPIFVDRQMVRHRVGVSKNEISGRYVEVQERVYTPAEFRRQARSNRQASVVDEEGTIDQAEAHDVWAGAWRTAYEAYERLLALGVTREQARGVLPQAMYTESYWTFNLRSLLHFLGLRDHKGAQYETMLYARAMAELAEPLFPVTFGAWRDLQAGAH